MVEKHGNEGQMPRRNGHRPSNVKPSQKYERFGETIRYLTMEEWQRLLDSIEDYRHKLMLRIIYHLGCRVGEFVRIRIRHIDFGRSNVQFPAQNTKTGHQRVSHLPKGVSNEIKSMLKQKGRMTRRSERVGRPDDYLFLSPGKRRNRYSENRIRQIFRQYVEKAGLDREYGRDTRGRKLHMLTIHSLRHSHIMHHIHTHKLPLPIVQKQVGHRTLKATSVYLNPTDEAVAEAYEGAGERS